MRPRNVFGIVLVTALLASSCSSAATSDTSTTVPATTSTTEAPPATTAPATTTTTTSTTSTTTLPPIPPLVVWADTTLAEALAGYAIDFEIATGIPVTVEAWPAAEITGAAIDAIAAGTGPDVFIGPHLLVAQLAAAGTIADIPIPDPDAYVPEALAAFTHDDALYGIPYAMATPALYMNTGMIEGSPTGGVDLAAVCEANEVVGTCVAIPADDPVTHLAIVRAFGGFGFGFTETGFDPSVVGLDTEGSLAAADFFDAQALLATLVPGDQAAEQFAAGDAAFYFGHPDGDPGPENWTAIPFQPAGAAGPAVAASVAGFMVNAGSTQPLAAQVFLTEFVASEELMFDLFTADWLLPARQRAHDDAVRADVRIAAFSPAGAGPDALLPYRPESGGLLAALADAIAVITGRSFTEDVANARAVFTAAAAALRGPEDEGDA